MRTEHYLFHVLWIALKSREKTCAQLRILKPPVAATDRSKAMILVYRQFLFYVFFGVVDQLANLHFHFTSVPRCTPMTD